MVQPWVPTLWHQDQSWLLIIHVLGGTAPRKAAPYDQTRAGEGRECWTRSWFLLQTPSGTTAAPWQAPWFCWFCDSPASAPAGFSTALPITETFKSRRWINHQSHGSGMNMEQLWIHACTRAGPDTAVSLEFYCVCHVSSPSDWTLDILGTMYSCWRHLPGNVVEVTFTIVCMKQSWEWR